MITDDMTKLWGGWLVGLSLLLSVLLVSTRAGAITPERCPASIDGQLRNSDASENGRLSNGLAPTTCAAPRTPQVAVPGVYHYDAHPFRNRNNAPTCINVTLTNTGSGAVTGLVQSAAYSNFLPNSPRANHLGNSGTFAAPLGAAVSYSFTVQALATFTVVVTQTGDGVDADYNLAVADCGDVAVAGVVPDSGRDIGGNVVRIRGAGFETGATVDFGGAAGTSVTVIDESNIDVTTPAHAPGLVDVAVTTAGVTRMLPGAFTFFSQITPTVTLTATPSTSVFGEAVTLSATVGPLSPRGPTGTVTFKDGATVLDTVVLDAFSNAQITVASFAVGVHALAVEYSGEDLTQPTNYFGPGTATASLTVGKAATTTTLSSSQNPSARNQTVTFTASVAPVAPGAGPRTGTVTFTVDGAPLPEGAVALVDGLATFSTSWPNAGTHAIGAAYNGDDNFSGSSAAVEQIVSLTATIIGVTAQPASPSAFGAAVAFTAAVSPSTATGNVDFKEGDVQLGRVAIVANGVATFTTSALSVGTHAITAAYRGDANNFPATATVTYVVGKAPTTTTVTSSKSPSARVEGITLTATIDSGATGTIDGTVVFKLGANTLGSSAVGANRTATLALTALTLKVGTHAITAVYSGNATFATSTSPPFVQIVEDVGGADAGTEPPIVGRPDASTRDGGGASGDNGAAAIEGGGACGCRAAGSGGIGFACGCAFAGVALALTVRRRRRSINARW
jgi:hypothetical protein